jgi:hypothetical protein
MSTYYVHPLTGDDGTGDGSSSAPWKTLAYTLTQVADGDTLELAAGDYLYADEGDLALSAKGITINGPTSGTARVFATLKFDGNGTQKAIAFSNWTLDGTGAGNTTTTGGTKSLAVIEDAAFVADGFRIENADYNGISFRADTVATRATLRDCYVQCGLAAGDDANKDCVSAEAANATLAAQSSVFVRGLSYGGHGTATNNQVVSVHSGVVGVVWEPHWVVTDGTAIAGDNNSPMIVVGGDIQFGTAALADGGVVAQIVVGLRTNGTIRYDRSGSVIMECVVNTANAKAVTPSVAGLDGVRIERCALSASGANGGTVDTATTANAVVRHNHLTYTGTTGLGYGTFRCGATGCTFEFNYCITTSHVFYGTTGAMTIRGNYATNSHATGQMAVYVTSFTSLEVDANILDNFLSNNAVSAQSAAGDTTFEATGNLIRKGNRGIQLLGAAAGGGTCTYTIASNAMSTLTTHSVQVVANSQTMTASSCGSNALSKAASGYTLATGDSITAEAAFDLESMPNPCGDLLQGLDGSGAVPLAMLARQWFVRGVRGNAPLSSSFVR